MLPDACRNVRRVGKRHTLCHTELRTRAPPTRSRTHRARAQASTRGVFLMLGARPRIAPTQHRTAPAHERPRAVDPPPAWGRVRGDAPPAPTVQPSVPAHLTPRKQRRHCEPDALQACSRDAAHWVTIQSSRVAAALQTACSGAEGAVPRETPTRRRLTVGRADGCSTGMARRPSSTPRARPPNGRSRRGKIQLGQERLTGDTRLEEPSRAFP